MQKQKPQRQFLFYNKLGNLNKRRTSVDIVVEAIQETQENSKDLSENFDNKFEAKTIAPFSYSRPTKTGQIKQYISTNLMLFQDESFNAKKDEYKTSLGLVKRDLERRKKDILEGSIDSLSHRALRPKVSHCEQRAKEKEEKKLNLKETVPVDKEDLPLIKQLEMSYEISQDIGDEHETPLKNYKPMTKSVPQDIVQSRLHELIQDDMDFENVLNVTLEGDESLTAIKQSIL